LDKTLPAFALARNPLESRSDTTGMAVITMNKATTTSRIGDQALKDKTGKTWREWFSVLDKTQAKKLAHKEIVAILQDKQGLGPWWGQMIAVGYEQERGLRVPHQKPNGFEISASRTIKTPVATAYLLFHDAKMRRRWLADADFEIRKATMNKSLRITWEDGKTSLSVDFYPKSANKTQVTVQHQKIESAKAAAKMKAYWSEQLDRLSKTLQG
jgi:uncharacterized protein YndB with AHSA1/START domain